jgi:hypothetical protein
VACGSDEVEQGMDTIVTEARVTLNTRLLCENVVVLPLEIANNLSEALIWSAVLEVVYHPISNLPCFVINLISETWRIDDGQGNTSSFLIQL